MEQISISKIKMHAKKPLLKLLSSYRLSHYITHRSDRSGEYYKNRARTTEYIYNLFCARTTAEHNQMLYQRRKYNNNNNNSRTQSLINDLCTAAYLLPVQFIEYATCCSFRIPVYRFCAYNIESGRVRTDGGNNELDKNLVSSPRDAIVSVPKGPPG